MLTPRQEEAFRLIAVKGLTIKDAAATMVVTRKTLDRTLKDANQRLGAKHGRHATYLWLLTKARDGAEPGGER